MNGKIILAAMLGAVLSMAATLAVANHKGRRVCEYCGSRDT